MTDDKTKKPAATSSDGKKLKQNPLKAVEEGAKAVKASAEKLAKKVSGKAEKKEEKQEKKLAPVKLKLLVTVVNFKKVEFYADFLQGYGANLQMILKGRGTASHEMMRFLGLTDSDKGVLFSVIREDKTEEIKLALEEKFETLNDGKGIAYTIPLTSTVGVAIYRFLSNTRKE